MSETEHAKTGVNKTLGASSCAASTCHGGVQAWAGSNILGNEFTTWSRVDSHRNAYQLMFSKEAKSIATNLGLNKPPNQTTACLNCHAQNPMLHSSFSTEGVSCESCHGPAGKWIGPHKSSTHEQNIKNGMYPTNQSSAQAKLCLSCHLGSEDQFITHRMMAAGHPRLNFELTTFTAIQPPHFVIDQDWRKRKGEYNPTKIWAIGQVIASQYTLNAFANPKLGHDGIFPELVLFDCHACHRQMTEKRGVPRWEVGPGRIHLNDSHFLMVKAIIKVAAPHLLDQFDAHISQLEISISADYGKSTKSPQELAKEISVSLDQYITLINEQPMDNKQLKSIFIALVEEASKGTYSEPSAAEQAYMAIANLSSELYKLRVLKSTSTVNKQLAEMRQNLMDDEHYQYEVFASQLNNLQKSVIEGR